MYTSRKSVTFGSVSSIIFFNLLFVKNHIFRNKQTNRHILILGATLYLISSTIIVSFTTLNKLSVADFSYSTSTFISLIIFLSLNLVFWGLGIFLTTQIVNRHSKLKVESNSVEGVNDSQKEVLSSPFDLDQIFNSTTNGLRIIDTQFNVLKLNESFCRITGIPFKEDINDKCYESFPSSSCHTTNCPLEQIKQGEALVEKQEVRFNRNNERVICQYSAKPFYGIDGELIGIIEDFNDVTELNKAQEYQLKTQQQFESLLNAMPVGVFIRDFEGNMFYQNTYMDKAFGSFNFERKNIKYVFPSTQVDRFMEEDKMVDKHGSVIVEEQLTDGNGIERTYVTHKFKFLGSKNQSLIGGVSIDITKRKNAEHNFYVLSKAINNSPIGVVITAPDGMIEFCNPEFAKLASSPKEELLGSTFPAFFELVNNPLRDAINKALLGTVYQEEKSLKLFSTDTRWYSISVAPVYNKKNEVAHLIFVFDDITQRKEYEKEMSIARTKAEESDRLKTAFLSNLSHEIRTPLNAILGFSSLLNNPHISDQEKLEIPALLLNHSNELLDIINDIIDVSAIETNQLTIKKTECKLNSLLIKTFNDFIQANRKKSLKTYIKLGVTEESFTILTDPDRLSQVVKHLLSNALKFTSNGFIEFGYTFKDANTLMFYVIDSGVGLEEEQKNFIFSPFRQAEESKTRNFNGLGLGLAISKHIIERLGGKIWVNSTKGEGSTFYFTLPYIPVRMKFEEYVPPVRNGITFDWTHKTIMVADDIDSNFVYIQTLLKPTGANLLWAKNGKEAINMAQSKDIDLVLMDIVMPEVDGFEATKQIKLIKNSIPVICQTAYPSPEHQKAGIESGMDKFLAKPIAAYDMLLAIDEYITKN